MINKIKKYDIISFDIFDTLITRNLDNPTDLFDFLQEEFPNIKDLKKKRIEAEKNAFENINDGEITFDEIYSEFEKLNTDIKKSIINKIKNTEVELEISICEVNNSFVDIYRKCVEANKMILIISDMYLSQNVIEKILKKNNITYNKLYVSSKYKKCKRNGELYKFIKSDLNLQNEKWLHFGDNLKSDYIIPNMLGIKASHVKYDKNNIILSKNIENCKYNFIKNFLNNHYKKENGYFYNIGYQVLGILLYSYIKWLESNILEKKYNKVFFLARDGKIMQRAMDIINPNIKSEYMYASRRAIIVPTLWKCETLDDIVGSMAFKDKITIRSFFKKIGLDENCIDLNAICKEFNYNLTDYINVEDEKNEKNFKLLYNNLKLNIIQNSKEEFNELVKYLESIEFKNKVAIVDIGWFGDMQKALNKICNYANLQATIEGYYLGVVPNSKIQDECVMNGFIFEKNKNEKLYYDEKMFNALFEIFFTTNHGSVKKIKNCMPILSKYEYESVDTEKFLIEIQNGAIDFIRDFIDYEFSKYIKIDEKIAFLNFKELGLNPRKCDLSNWKDVVFHDIEYINLIENVNFLINPIKFITLLKKSIWKIGFLKKNFIYKLNYYKLFKWIRG